MSPRPHNLALILRDRGSSKGRPERGPQLPGLRIAAYDHRV
jgi:hypothetical protein